VTNLPNLDHLSHAEKDALIHALWVQVQALTVLVAELETRLGRAGEELGQFQLAPIARQEAEPRKRAEAAGSAPGQRRSQGRWPAAGGESGRDGDRTADLLRAVPGSIRRCRPQACRPLRQD
jgi:hypothetical protein